jgi:hypothetical protein
VDCIASAPSKRGCSEARLLLLSKICTFQVCSGGGSLKEGLPGFGSFIFLHVIKFALPNN